MYLHTQREWSPDHSEVYKGERFAISCESNTPHNVLSMRLKYGDTEHQTEMTQSLVDEGAIFVFSAAEEAHNNTYQCDYNCDVSSDIFSDLTTFNVTIKGKVYWCSTKFASFNLYKSCP